MNIYEVTVQYMGRAGLYEHVGYVVTAHDATAARIAIENMLRRGYAIENMPWRNGVVNNVSLLVGTDDTSTQKRYHDALRELQLSAHGDPECTAESAADVWAYVRSVVDTALE